MTSTLPAIDMWPPILPTPDILRHAAAHFPKEMLGYLRIFYKDDASLESFRGPHRPKYFATPGTGWEPLLRFGQTTIADKVLFGTGWFLLGRPPVAVAEEFRALPVKPAIMEKWLSGNAERLLADCSGPTPRG